LKQRIFQHAFFSCALLASGLLGSAASAHAEPVSHSVKVQVNDDLVTFPDAQPYIDEQDKLQVPVRFISDELGYKVDWVMNGSAVTVTLTKGDRTIIVDTGSGKALVNGNEADLDGSPQFRMGRVYVPLRFLAEREGFMVQWDNNNRIGIVCKDGKYHAPAWYAPSPAAAKPRAAVEKTLTVKASAYSDDPAENAGTSLDYFGNPLKLGTIAVDPDVIPLGSKVYITGYTFDGLPAGGMMATAADIGGAIRGNRIDIFIPGTPDYVSRFGLQNVKVEVLR